MSRQLALTGETAASVIEAVVERTLHQNEESGWSVLLVDVEGQGRQRAVGTFAGIRPGETLRLEGEWVEHPKFGRQFRVSHFRPVDPETLLGIERYLAGFIDGIDAKLAKRIVKRFGHETLDVFAEQPERLREVRGIGKKRKKQILEAWQENQSIREVMVLLHGFGISSNYAVKIYKRFGDGTIDQVRRSPYSLTVIDGIGFHRADAIARAQGLAPDSPDRAAAGVVHVLEEASSREGHMFLERRELCRRTRELLGVELDLADAAIEELCQKKRLAAYRHGIYLRGLETAERLVADCLRALLAEETPALRVETALAINRFEAQERVTLAEAQRETLRQMVENKVMVLTGGPGTGKTTLTKGIVYMAGLAGLTVELAAPTGRAAKRLAEATRAEARTIHRLLEFQQGEFKRNQDNQLEADLLVIDEASMLDVPLARRLLVALPGSARLVIVGDVDQLPSVGPGRVLGDLIESGEIPVVRLTEIFRQAQESLIVTNAHSIIHGEMPVPGTSTDQDFFVAWREDETAALEEIKGLVGRRIGAQYGFVPLRDIQVLAPMRRGVLGIHNLNVELQDLLNPEGASPKWAGRRLRQGDRVMQTSNNYDLEVFNGEIGTVAAFEETWDEEKDKQTRQVLVDFDPRVVAYPVSSLDELELAYAVTIHKAQGSEFPCVVVALHQQHYVMLRRNLFYTAVTRGKQLVIVVGARRALQIATRTETTHRRETLLVERLRDGPIR